MTAAEARQRAAQIALQALRGPIMPDSLSDQDWRAVSAEIHAIEKWLRRRLIGQDKILTRQMERPTGRQVKASPKQARKLRIPDGTKP